MTKDDVLQRLRQHKRMLQERYGVERIGLFGSYAKGEQTAHSDIDLFVVFRQKTLDNITGLWLFLEEMYGKNIDLFYRHARMREGLKTQIEEEIIYA